MADVTREELALTRAADVVSTAHADLSRVINAMTGRLSTQGTWEGTSATGFTNLVTVWTTETDKVTRALTDFSDKLTSSEKTYVATDDAHADTFNRIAGRLGS